MADAIPYAPYPNADEEKDYAAKADAEILLLADEIQKDPERRKAAASALKQMAEEQKNRAEDTQDLANRAFEYRGM